MKQEICTCEHKREHHNRYGFCLNKNCDCERFKLGKINTQVEKPQQDGKSERVQTSNSGLDVSSVAQQHPLRVCFEDGTTITNYETKQPIIIEFKSLPRYWNKEKSGKKPNTVRDVSDWTKERVNLYKKATHVKMTNSVTQQYFIRRISDKTTWESLRIISWYHETEI